MYNGNYSMQDWIDNNYKKCECGADKLQLGEYGHSHWCPMFIAPVPISDSCNCGIGSWHSPLCKNRVDVQKPVDELHKIQLQLKEAINKLNADNGTTKERKDDSSKKVTRRF